MSYCSNCGQEMPVGARFCSGCGAAQPQPQQIQQPVQPVQQPMQPVQPAQPVQQPMQPQQYGQPVQPQGQFYGMPMNGFVQPKKRKKPLIIILSILGVLCIAAAIVLPLSLNGKDDKDDKASSKRVLEEYISAVEQGDYYRMVSVYLPEEREWYDEELEEYYGGDVADYMEDEYGDMRDIDWTIRDVRELSDDELDELNEEIAEYYDENYTVTCAFCYNLEVNITYENGETDTNNYDDIYVVKVGSRWYLYD